jgi:hypothetical protein
MIKSLGMNFHFMSEKVHAQNHLQNDSYNPDDEKYSS